ncbi:Hypothetical protein PBC10988_2870 [Planctomycetales bacterium 10988]|nr:Hypothetical protein PBC10988_2870 [Planctomycetales bacterium 10988]
MKDYFNKIRHWFRSHAKAREDFKFFVESLESRQLLAAVPSVTMDVPDTVTLGEGFTLELSFDNTSVTDVGYGPYIDLYLPTTGVDGIYPGTTPGVDEYDGVTFDSATYLGSAITPTIVSFDASGQLMHPLAVDSTGSPLILTGTPGDQLLVFQLPFGSFTPNQPEAILDVHLEMSPLADVNTPLTIQASGGFQYGNTPLNDPATDPTIVSSTVSEPIEPTLFEVRKVYNGPEDETATGPNYPRTYTIQIDVADGQTLEDIEVTDFLPNNVAFLSVISITGGVNGTTTETPTVGVAANSPDNDLIIHFDSITGTAGDIDAAITFEFFIPEFDAEGNPVINPANGNDVLSLNNVTMDALWDPLDVRDQMGSPIVVSQDFAAPEHILVDKSIAVQKDGEVVIDVGAPSDGDSISPGDTIEYTLDIQISDYFAFDNLVVTDIFSDGQRFDSSYAPTLSFLENGVLTSYTFVLGSSYTVTLNADNNPATPATDGSTTMVFDVSQLLIDNGGTGQVLGGLVPDGLPINDGPARGVITFRTIVQDQFSDNFTSNDPSLKEGDTVSNMVSISGDVLDNTTLNPTGFSEEDTSSDTHTVTMGGLSKDVYAINGVVGAPAVVTAGDTVTYRLTSTFSTGDFESLLLTDYLPLPIFFADDPDADGIGGHTWTIDVSGTPADVPGVGQFKFGPNDTFSSDFPATAAGIVVTVDPGSNRLIFDFGDNQDLSNQPMTIELLFTVTASAEPFVDGLFLTNQVHQTRSNSSDETIARDDTAQIQVSEPSLLQLTKGVIQVDGVDTVTLPGAVNSNYLAANPINQYVDGLDAADIVTFAITLENIGSGVNGAFDIRIHDGFLPDDYVIPTGGINLMVTRGDGTVLSYTDLGGGLFGNGIEIIDGAGVGALSGYDATSGTNVLLVTYNLEVAGDVEPEQDLENTAVLFNYASAEGGPDFTDPNDLEATVVNNTTELNVEKALIGTSLNTANNSNTQAVIGEIVTYSVTIDLPEGVVEELFLEDLLDPGMAFLDFLSITPSSGDITTNVAGGFPGVLAGVSVTSFGRRMTLDLGNVTNANTDNSIPESITLVYRAVVINSSDSQRGNDKNNRAEIDYDDAVGNVLTDHASAANIRILEPVLTVDKTVNQATGDSGDQIEYLITVTNDGSVSDGTDAYDVTLSDLLPGGVTFVSLDFVSGLMADFETPGANVGLVWNLFEVGQTSTYRVTVDVNANLAPGLTITNTAEIEWTSLPTDVTTPQSPYNSLSVERTGDTMDPGGAVNDYRDSEDADFTIVEPMISKTIEDPNTDTSRIDTGTGQGDPALVDLAIGEIVTYTLRVYVPEVQTDLVVLDNLFPNANVQMEYLSSSVFSIGGNTTNGAMGGGNLTVSMLAVGDVGSFDGGANTVTFDFGSVTNSATAGTADPMDDANSIVLLVTARVANVPDNINKDVHTNVATVIFDDGNNPGMDRMDTDSVQTDIVEPILNITKSANTSTADAGDTITYTVTVNHLNPNVDSRLTAYDLRITDLIDDPYLELVVGSVMVSGGTDVLTILEGNTSGDTQVTVATDQLDLGTSVITITYNVIVLNAAPPNTNLENTAEVDWDNLPGSLPDSSPDPYERRPDDTATETVLTTSPTVSKVISPIPNATSLDTTGSGEHDPSLVDLAIGETVSYDLVITLTEGQTSLSVEDVLPPGLSYVSHQIVLSATTNLTLTNNPPLFTNSSGTLNFDFSTVTNAPDGAVDADDQLIIRLIALVENQPSNVDAAVKTNTVTVDFSTGTVSDSVDVEVVEPELQLLKTVDTGNADSTRADANDVVTYTVTVSHTAASTSDAYDLIIQDLLTDADLDLIAGTVTVVDQTMTPVGTVLIGNTMGDTTVVVQVDHLARGDSIIITFDARTSTTVSPGDEVDNVSEVDFDSYPGTGGRPDAEMDDAQVFIFSNSISGFVYNDADNDGVFDSGELPIPGVLVSLTGMDHLGNPVTLIELTDATGAYSFEELRPSDAAGYTITEVVQPAGYLDGTDTLGTGGGIFGNDVFTQVLLPAGQESHFEKYNFGEIEPSSLAGTVFDDLNNNGLQEGSDLGIEGVTIQLTGMDDLGSVSRTTTTDANGGYLFENLRPGTYIITEMQPFGYLDGIDSLGTVNGVSNGDDSTNDVFSIVTLTTDDTGIEYNFAELRPASISGTVFNDRNNNGIQEPGDLGIFGVNLRLTGTNDLGAITPIDLTTNALGHYTFENLRPGTYTVSETQPVGLFDGIDTVGSKGGDGSVNDVTSAIPIVADDVAIHYDFAELRPASISGTVFDDRNDNGIQDSGELGIAGVNIRLTGINDQGMITPIDITTNLLGEYTFDNLRPGTYAVFETQPAGYFDGIDTVGSEGGSGLINDVTFNIPIFAGAKGVNYNFAEIKPSSLAGTVFDDLNNNGIQESGEPGIEGVTLILTGTNQFGPIIPVLTTTNSLGEYLFDNLRAGTYTVREMQPANYLDGIDTVGSEGGNGSVNDVTSAILIEIADVAVNYNFAELRPSSISGTVYLDPNNNATQDTGEPGLSGVEVTLTGMDDLGQTVFRTTITNADGDYAFVELRPGEYAVTETQPAGLLDGEERIGSVGGNLVPPDTIDTITVIPDTHAVNYDFAELPPSSLAGTVFDDLNNDGLKDANEAGIAGVTVSLLGFDDRSNLVQLQLQTDGDGNYLFENLRPGYYVILEAQPTGYLDGIDTAGSIGGIALNDQIWLSIDPGQDGIEYNFGELQPASLSGLVFEDRNDNGIQNRFDPGIAGVTITLEGIDDLSNPVNLVTTADSNGNYLFENLRPGTYSITETQPASFLDGKDQLGSLGGQSLMNDEFSNIVLIPGNNGTDYNFADLLPDFISGRVYVDFDNDGIDDLGEPGIPGVTLFLTGIDDLGNNVTQMTTTDQNGNYLFQDLRLGIYAVTEVQPVGYIDGLETPGSLGGFVVGDNTIAGIELRLDVSRSYDNNFGELLALPPDPNPPQPPVPPTPNPPIPSPVPDPGGRIEEYIPYYARDLGPQPDYYGSQQELLVAFQIASPGGRNLRFVMQMDTNKIMAAVVRIEGSELPDGYYRVRVIRGGSEVLEFQKGHPLLVAYQLNQHNGRELHRVLKLPSNRPLDAVNEILGSKELPPGWYRIHVLAQGEEVVEVEKSSAGESRVVAERLRSRAGEPVERIFDWNSADLEMAVAYIMGSEDLPPGFYRVRVLEGGEGERVFFKPAVGEDGEPTTEQQQSSKEAPVPVNKGAGLETSREKVFAELGETSEKSDPNMSLKEFSLALLGVGAATALSLGRLRPNWESEVEDFMAGTYK